jgi:3-oxoacyl-[acyl-carrier protein] reductase
MAKLDGRVALISGGGRGIGRAVALGLAREGAKVVVNDIDPAPVEEVVDAIRENGGEAVACVGSVTDSDFPQRFVATALDNYGDIHIIINNAGYTWDAVIQNMTEEQYDAMIDVHLKAPWRILKEAAAVIRAKAKEEAESGKQVVRKVVNVSSISGTRGNAGQSNYSSAKAGVIGLTRSLAREWGRYQVTVNCVAFGFIQTRLTEATDEKRMIAVGEREVPIGVPVENIRDIEASIPLGRAGTPGEAAGAVLLFCFPESDYISGQVVEVSGGQ